MRFLRMRPAVCAMISCSFSSLTRKVAFGSNSVTTPGNSSSSSFVIRYPDLLQAVVTRPTSPLKSARNVADDGPLHNHPCGTTTTQNFRFGPMSDNERNGHFLYFHSL